MTRTAARLAALERQASRDHTITVWRQDTQGADAYTSRKHPGVTLTRAQLAERPEPAGGTRIVVEYVTPHPAAHRGGGVLTVSKELRQRLARLEAAAANPSYVTGWTITRDGELIGFAPSFGRPDPALAAWLADPVPGFVFLIARDVADTPAEDLAGLIPADQASDQALRLVEPYTQPGAALHLAA